MSQDEICKLLEKEKELTTREISEKLNQRYSKVSATIGRMVGIYLETRYLSNEELKMLKCKYPTTKHAKGIRVYRLKDDSV